MRINNNIIALNSHRQYGINAGNLGRNVERLSSGFRVNRAADDAAGLAISEKMRSQIRGLNQASRNALDGVSLVQTAEGGMQTIQNVLQRMRELAVQAGNDTNAIEDRLALQLEINQLIDEVDQIAQKTEFNEMTLLSGAFSQRIAASGQPFRGIPIYSQAPDFVMVTARTLILQVGANQWQRMHVNIASMTARGLGIHTFRLSDQMMEDLLRGQHSTPGARVAQVEIMEGNIGPAVNGINRILGHQLWYDDAGFNTVGVLSHALASAAISVIHAAVLSVSMARAALGAVQNRLEFKIHNLDNQAENVSAAESRIRDADMAAEMTTFTRNNILFQASTAMLAQANALPQTVLQLLG